MSRRGLSHGFTLVELLVVIVIIAAIAGVAVLAIGNRDAGALRSEAQRLQQLLMFARDEAMYRYKNYGLLQEEESYRLQVYNDLNGEWETPAGPLFEPHPLPAPMRLSIMVEGELVMPPVQPEQSEDFQSSTESPAEAKPPQLLMLSSGETTPFEIRLQAAEDSPLAATLSSDGFSPITLVYHNEAQ